MSTQSGSLPAITPATEEDLSAAIRDATAPLSVAGGGTRGILAQGEPLSTAGLTGVTLYEPGALTLVARAGTPVAKIEKVLAAEGQRLAFEPMDHRALTGGTGTPTIGGVLAANISGPRRIQVGAARDHALGVRFVDGTGAVVKNGGRVMKNVTGYDLVKLLCGSWGTLGVISEVSLKVLPVPEHEITLQIPADSPATAVSLMAGAFSSPYDVSGAACFGGVVQLRLEGFANSVRYRADQLRAHLAQDVALLEGSDSRDLWISLRDVSRFADRDAVWKISLKPTDAPGCLAAADIRDVADYQLDWAGGLVWLGLDAERLASCGGLQSMHARLQDHCAKSGGHATLVKSPEPGVGTLCRFQPEPAALAALSSGIRARFDPRGILNPGLMSPRFEEAV